MPVTKSRKERTVQFLRSRVEKSMLSHCIKMTKLDSNMKNITFSFLHEDGMRLVLQDLVESIEEELSYPYWDKKAIEEDS